VHPGRARCGPRWGTRATAMSGGAAPPRPRTFRAPARSGLLVEVDQSDVLDLGLVVFRVLLRTGLDQLRSRTARQVRDGALIRVLRRGNLHVEGITAGHGVVDDAQRSPGRTA